MFTTLSTLYTAYSYIDDTSTLGKLVKALKMYARFVVFYLRNPEVQIKYIRKLNGLEKEDDALNNIKNTITEEGFQFNHITEGKNDLNFSLDDSNLNYRVVKDEHPEK
jgi:hypothetical protein